MKCILCQDDNTKIYQVVDNFTVVRCLNDGLIYVNPQPSEGEIRDFYKDAYLKKDNGVKSGYGYRHYLDEGEILRKNSIRILEKVEGFGPDKGRILDVGCACGFLVKCAQKRNWEAFGVDIDQEAIQRGKEELGVNVFAGTANSCNFPDRYFDVISFIGVIEHFLDPLKEFKEISRILKDDGLICITTGYIDNLIGARYLKPVEHLYYFSRKTLRIFLQKVGFKIIRQEPYFRIFSLKGFLAKFLQYTYRVSNSVYFKQIYRYSAKLTDLSRIGKFAFPIYSGQILIIAKKAR